MANRIGRHTVEWFQKRNTHTEKLKQPTHDFPLSTHTRRFTGTYRKKGKKKYSQEDGANNKIIEGPKMVTR
jgi:hypothetical protein